ncbi:restriction endonuclease subunit S [Chryseobacterium sp.]|uniref:restriction endonuclease subunit S n=1 Tax=Chryseobacterium sp. TaxID=1871047 RepID=UPI0012AA6F96|nr:restriction endonuclease subunit S [Chryseobacterium sp.]QFG53410.1 restriction endonuclease subunit S [Chryseobacterium sp.]
MRIKIGDACEFINGGSWTESDYRECGLPVLKVSNFNSSGFTINDISFLNSELGNKYIKNKLEINDIIIATVGSHPSLVNSAAGRTIRVNSNVVNYFLNQNAICLRVNYDENINQIYLYYLTETTEFRNFIQQRGKGAANQMRIPISGIKDFSWDFPPLETQKKIASILSGYDDLIENNLKRIKILQEMAQQTYEEWFVRMRFPGHESATINPETGLPEGWEKVKIENLCMVSGGGTPSKNNKEYWIDGDINWFTPSDLTKNKSLVITDSELKTNSLGISKSSAKILQSDSFIMTSRATIGVFALLDKPFSTNQGFINITPNHKNLKGYLLYNFIFRMDQLKGLATGATFPELSKSKFKVLDIIKPSVEVLNQFSEYFDVITKQLFNLTYQNQRLREARDILLPRLMMGMVEV